MNKHTGWSGNKFIAEDNNVAFEIDPPWIFVDNEYDLIPRPPFCPVIHLDSNDKDDITIRCITEQIWGDP